MYYAIMLPPEVEEFPTKGMTPIHKKWMMSKGKLKGRDKKRVSRFGDRQYHLMEKGTRKQKKAKEMLFSALQDDYSINPVTETETVDFITEKERELEILFCELWDEKRHPHYDEDWVDLHGYIMDEIREEIFSIYDELSYIK